MPVRDGYTCRGDLPLVRATTQSPPPPRAARQVDEDDQPCATEQGGNYRPVRQTNKALEGEVDPHFLKEHHIRGVV